MPTGSFARATRRDTICSLTTRDPVEKTQVQFIRKMSWTLLSGVIIGMIINMVVLPMWLEKDINGYPILMVSLSINKGVEKALEFKTARLWIKKNQFYSRILIRC